MEDRQPYGVYVQVDEGGRITDINSTAFLASTDGWTQIDAGLGDRYHHAQGNYLQHPIFDERGVYRYKLEDGVPVERTQEEMEADYVAPVPTPSDSERITALENQLAAYEAAYTEGVNEA